MDYYTKINFQKCIEIITKKSKIHTFHILDKIMYKYTCSNVLLT